MDSDKWIQSRLQAWANRRGVTLQGSAGTRGVPNYTATVEKNIFGNKLSPATRRNFEQGAGGELRGEIPAMSALHSSAAMAVNLFQYWIDRNDLPSVATMLGVRKDGIASGCFEDQYPVCENPRASGFNRPPHLDFALRYLDGRRVGVECKLFEPYGRLDHAKLGLAYCDLTDAWEDIPACAALARMLTAGSAGFNRLGPSQLLKHILGLKFQTPTKKVTLIYLYLDAIGDQAAEHRDEIKKFQAAVAGDPFSFVPISVQQFIARMRTQRESHRDYVDYLTERYL